MYQVTEAVARALETGQVHYRLLSEAVPLWVPNRLPVWDRNGMRLYVLAQGAVNGVASEETLLSLNYTAPCCDGDIGLGNVCAASLNGTIHGALSLLGETLRAEMGVEIEGAMEWLPLGRFVVDECSRSDDDTRFTAHDANFYATGKAYVPRVSGSVTVSDVLMDLAEQCGLEAEQTTVNLGLNVPVLRALTGMSCRDILGHLALLCARNCVITREGKLRFVWFSEAGSVDGENYYDGGLSNSGTSCLSGIRCTVPPESEDGEEQTLTVGNLVGALDVSCPYMTQNLLEGIWYQRGDWNYHTGEVNLFSGALLEPGDLVRLTNRDGVSVQFPVMQTTLTLDGGCRCTISSWGKAQVARENVPQTPVQRQLTQLGESAHRAMVSANGKNKVFHQPSPPSVSEGLTAGDTWFDTLNDNCINTWSGTVWEPFALGENAIADLSITNAKIANGTIHNGKIANLDAGKITTGTLDAARIGAGSITASKLYVNSLSSVSANVGTLTTGVLMSSNYSAGSAGMKLDLTNGTADITGTVRANNGKLGGWTISSSEIYRSSASFGSPSGMYFGEDGLSITDKFQVDNRGNLRLAGNIVLGYHGIATANTQYPIFDLNADGTVYVGGRATNTDTNATFLRGNTVRIYSHTDGAVYLGSSGSTAITSDETMKDIREIDQRYENFFMRLHPVLYKYHRIGHRTHIGYGAREVEQALTDSGITTEEFAGILIDRDVTICADEAQTETDQHYDELYSLRYQEFGALYALMLQKALRRIENLEARVSALEGNTGDAEDE